MSDEVETIEESYIRGVQDLAIGLKMNGYLPSRYHHIIDYEFDKTLELRGIKREKRSGWER